ncbi:MAG: RDD family protein, partial [Solirubrobacterales bacterium]
LATAPAEAPPTAIQLPVVTGPEGVVAAAPLDAPVYKLAQWSQRVVASIVDGVIMGLAVTALLKVLGSSSAEPGGALSSADLPMTLAIVIAVSAVYLAGMTTYNNGQTIGKKISKIRTVREDGRPVELGWALFRETFAKTILGFIYAPVDAIWPLPDKQNRALHDMIVKSRVVKE